MTLSPLYRRRLQNFRRNRRGYVAFWIFLVMFIASMASEFICNDRPLFVSYKGEWLFPVFVNYPEDKFGGFGAVTDYRDPVISDEIEAPGFIVWAPIRFTNNMGGDDPAFDDFLFELVYARPDYLQSNGETVRGFLRAFVASVNEILDTPSAAHMPALRALFGGAGDDVILESFENTKSIFSRDGVVTPASVQKAGSCMVESGAVKTAATFDQVAANDFLPKR